jgi:hypothetical protein
LIFFSFGKTQVLLAAEKAFPALQWWARPKKNREAAQNAKHPFRFLGGTLARPVLRGSGRNDCRVNTLKDGVAHFFSSFDLRAS